MASTQVSISNSFPEGLRVLLVDFQPSVRHVETQLRLQHYTVTSCSSSEEALGYCRAGVSSFDVVLAEARLVAGDEAAGRSFIDSFEDTPVILMSECSTTGDVLRAVKLGAVDWLDKPLSVLKLRNIWQHSVRKMMQRSSSFDSSCASGDKGAAAQARRQRSCGSGGLESPATPTIADSAEAMDAISAVSFGSIKDLTEYSVAGQEVRASFDSCDGGDAYTTGSVAQQLGHGGGHHHPHQPRPPMAVKPSSFGPLVPVPPPSQWPQLQPGCVWGTPVGGPLAPPPLPVPAPSCQPGSGFVPSASHMSLSSLMEEDTHLSLPSAPAGSDGTAFPDNFLDLTEVHSERGPIGLKLRKSNSLLNLINATLTTGPAC